MLTFNECGFGMHLYSDIETKETYFESWNASTKHPDVSFRFSNYDKSPYMSDIPNLIGWLCYIASDTAFHWSLFAYVDYISELVKSARVIDMYVDFWKEQEWK